MNEEDHRVRCPFCGYRMPVEAPPGAVAKGLYVKCKGRDCRRRFEIVLQKTEKETTG